MSGRLRVVAVATTHGTWVHPYAREIVAETFSDNDLPKEDATSRRRPDLDDLADMARYSDSLIASRTRRRQTHDTTGGDIAMRVLLVVALVAVLYAALVLFGIALT